MRQPKTVIQETSTIRHMKPASSQTVSRRKSRSKAEKRKRTEKLQREVKQEMKLGRLNHVGVATPSIERRASRFIEPCSAPNLTRLNRSISQRRAFGFASSIRSNISQIELIEPLGDTSPILKFLEKNPAGGQHHVCFETSDIEEARAFFEGKGARILGPTRIGAHGSPVFFLHPKDMGGVLTEIMETPEGSRLKPRDPFPRVGMIAFPR